MQSNLHVLDDRHTPLVPVVPKIVDFLRSRVDGHCRSTGRSRGDRFSGASFRFGNFLKLVSLCFGGADGLSSGGCEFLRANLEWCVCCTELEDVESDVDPVMCQFSNLAR